MKLRQPLKDKRHGLFVVLVISLFFGLAALRIGFIVGIVSFLSVFVFGALFVLLPLDKIKFFGVHRKVADVVKVILVVLLFFFVNKAYRKVQTNSNARISVKEAQQANLPGQPILRQYYEECHDTSAGVAPGPTSCSKNYQILYANSDDRCRDFTMIDDGLQKAGYIRDNTFQYVKTGDPVFKERYGNNPTDCQVVDFYATYLGYNINYSRASGSNAHYFVTCKYGSEYSKYDLDKLSPAQHKVNLDRSKVYGCQFTH